MSFTTHHTMQRRQRRRAFAIVCAMIAVGFAAGWWGYTHTGAFQ